MGLDSTVRNNPVASTVAVSSPLLITVSWLLGYLGVKIDQTVESAFTCVALTVVVFFGRGLRVAGSAVWTYGLFGVIRRILRGPPPQGGK